MVQRLLNARIVFAANETAISTEQSYFKLMEAYDTDTARCFFFFFCITDKLALELSIPLLFQCRLSVTDINGCKCPDCIRQ